MAKRSSVRRVALGGCSVLVMAIALGLSGCASSGGGVTEPELLSNPGLSPAYSQWLIGPIAALATAQEEQEYLALTNDFAAVDFIEAFWARRDTDTETVANPLRERFELRARRADQRFSESSVLGRRTDRGTTFIIYGAPERIEFDTNPNRQGLPVELWHYPENAPVGLDGKQPKRVVRFRKQGDLTKFFQGNVNLR